jgi:hypothetical protein
MTKESAQQIAEELTRLACWKDYVDKFSPYNNNGNNAERSLLWAVYSSVFKKECVEWYEGKSQEDANKKLDEIRPIIELLRSQGIPINVETRSMTTSPTYRLGDDKEHKNGQILISVGWLERKK